MRDPERLPVSEAAMQVAEITYRVTKRFPAGERAGLSSQMRRAAVSIGSNIWEGCGRSTDAQFISFLQIAMGSACELEFQTNLSGRLAFAQPEELLALQQSLTSLKRMLARLTTVLRARSSQPPKGGARSSQSPRGGASRRRPESERSEHPD